MNSEETGSAEPAERLRQNRARAVPRLHVVCPDVILRKANAELRLIELLEAGAADVALHLRPRETPVRRCLDLAFRLTPIADRSGSWLVVNGRTDVARIVRPQAVQLGHGALPVGAVRILLGPECAIGVSVHSWDDCRRAQAAGADFLLLGTIFPTPSHSGEAGAGPSLVSRCAGTELPVIAIGGIDDSNIAEVRGAGAHGAAVIRAVWEADDPVGAIRRLCALLRSDETSGE